MTRIRKAALAVLAASPLAALPAPVQAEPAPAPLYVFLKAADVGDTATMRSMVKTKIAQLNGGALTPQQFFGRLEGCYLRRVYVKDEKEIIAAWMCSVSGDPGRSRVILAGVANRQDGVELYGMIETQKDQPPPPRTEPALPAEGG